MTEEVMTPKTEEPNIESKYEKTQDLTGKVFGVDNNYHDNNLSLEEQLKKARLENVIILEKIKVLEKDKEEMKMEIKKNTENYEIQIESLKEEIKLLKETTNLEQLRIRENYLMKENTSILEENRQIRIAMDNQRDNIKYYQSNFQLLKKAYDELQKKIEKRERKMREFTEKRKLEKLLKLQKENDDETINMENKILETSSTKNENKIDENSEDVNILRNTILHYKVMAEGAIEEYKELKKEIEEDNNQTKKIFVKIENYTKIKEENIEIHKNMVDLENKNDEVNLENLKLKNKVKNLKKRQKDVEIHVNWMDAVENLKKKVEILDKEKH